eukprot:jgi/Tetstr1/436522/TSEL_025348.t1
MARNRLHLPTRLKGADIRRMATARDAAFLGCVNDILPRFLTRNSDTNTPTPGFFDPQLESVLGRGSFNTTSSARRYDHFLNDARGSGSYAAAVREAWGRLQAAADGHLSDADARVMEREAEAASGSHKELTAFLDQANNSRLRNEVDDLFQQAVPPGNTVPRDVLKDLVPDAELPLPAFNVVTGSYDPRSLKSTLLEFKTKYAKGPLRDILDMSEYTGMVFGTLVMTPHVELRDVAAGYFFLHSPCMAKVVGIQIILRSTEHNPVTGDLYGNALAKNLLAPGGGHWRVQHDAIADAFRDQCVHDLGIVARREVDDLFQQAVPLGDTVPRDVLKDLVPDAELPLPAFNVVTGSYDPRSLKPTLLEFKTLRYAVKYTAVSQATGCGSV